MASSRQKAFLVTSDLISVFLFSGIVFGWAAFNKMLIKEGYYAFLCDEGAKQCIMQEEALNAAYTAASTAVSIVALPGGMFIDYFGPRFGALVAGFLNVGGLLGMAISKEYGGQDYDIFYYSLIMQAIGGSLTMFCGYQAPFLFPRQSTLLIECTSCLFDAGTLIFPLLKLAFDAGLPFDVIFYVYVGVAFVNFIMLVVSWNMCTPELMEVRRAAGDAPLDGNEETLASKPLFKQILTLEFLAIFIYSVIQVPRSNIYMGTIDMVNSDIAGKSGQTGSTELISTIIGLLIPFGFLSVPIIEACIQYGGVITTLYITTVMGWVYNVLQLVPELYTQLGAVVVFAVWRAFLFSVISAFNAEVFGPRSMGRIMGLGFLFSGLMNFVQTPLLSWTLKSQDGDFTGMLLIVLAVSVPLPLFFAAVKMKWRKMTARAHAWISGSRSTMKPVFSHGVAGCAPNPHILEAAIERGSSARAAKLQDAAMAQAPLTQF